MLKSRIPRATARQLAAFFDRNGYVRRQDQNRAEEEGWDGYKKGDEVRMTVWSQKELALLRRLLRQAGYRAKKSERKGRGWRVSVYGHLAVERFLILVTTHLPAEPGVQADRKGTIRRNERFSSRTRAPIRRT